MIFMKIGIIFCLLSVIIGAFGAHGLSSMIGDKVDIFKTGVQYQIFHSLALILTGILARVFSLDLSTVGYLFIIGIIIFSGSLYIISLYKYSFLGMITPVGGLFFIIGWLVLYYKISNLI